jgi:hypothetical protein
MDARHSGLKAGKFPASWWNGIHLENPASCLLERISSSLSLIAFFSSTNGSEQTFQLLFPLKFRMKNPENIIRCGFVDQLARNHRHFSVITRFVDGERSGKGSRFSVTIAVQKKYCV